MQVSLVIKNRLESYGFTVFERYDAKKGKSFTYVHHPENNLDDPLRGLDIKFFVSLADITKETVDDGEYIDLDWYNWPVNYCPPYPHNPGEGYDALVDNWEQMSLGEDGLVYWWVVWLICAAIAMTVFVVVSMLVWFIQTVNAPCNYEEHIINDCWKSITATDCTHAEFNSCGGPDANGDGRPDGQWAGAPPGESGTPNWQKDVFDPTELIMWVVIGVIAIAAVFVVVKMIPEKKQQPYYYPPPQYQPPPEQQKPPT